MSLPLCVFSFIFKLIVQIMISVLNCSTNLVLVAARIGKGSRRKGSNDT